MKQNEPAIHIRIGTLDDSPAIASVLYESFIQYEDSYTPEAFAATTLSIDHIKKRMSEGPVWVALLDGDVVGTVSAVVKDDALYIRGMAVLPAARGHGIGELLLQQIETFALTQGRRRLFLSTTPFLTRAIRLYEHAGFRRSNEGPHDLFETPLFTMTKALSPPIDTHGVI